MNMKTALGGLLAAGALALAFTGPAGAAEQVNIGFSGPLSGGAALYGENALEGLKMAAKEVNEAGGFKVGEETYTLNLVSLDDKYAPSRAAVNGKRLVQQHKTPVIFAAHSGGSFALQEFNQQDGFIVMSYTPVPSVTASGNLLTVKIPPSFTDYIEPFSKISMARFGKRLAVANAMHDYAKYWTKEMVPVWEKMGGEVVAMNPMDYNKSADFYTDVSKTLATKPDVMFIGGPSEPTGLVVRQALELGFKGGFILMDQAKIDEVARIVGDVSSLEGTVGTVPLADYDTPGARQFVALYARDHNTIASAETAHHYFSMHLVVQAMQEAGTVDDAARIRAAMAAAVDKIPSEKNPYGVHAISDNGDLLSAPRLAEVLDGKVVHRDISKVMEN